MFAVGELGQRELVRQQVQMFPFTYQPGPSLASRKFAVASLFPPFTCDARRATLPIRACWFRSVNWLVFAPMLPPRVRVHVKE